MFGIENVVLFLGTGILLNLYPGPDTLYIIGRSLSQGRAAGVCAALGIGSGAVVHTLLGAFGLSALLAASACAFLVLKYLGCAYLVYQGILLIIEPQADPPTRTQHKLSRTGLWRIYRQGALTNILNPKVAVFFLAFLPQFISASSSSKPLSFIVLGGIFITTGTIWCLCVALCAASVSRRFGQSTVMRGRLKKLNGALFCLLGIKLATASIDL